MRICALFCIAFCFDLRSWPARVLNADLGWCCWPDFGFGGSLFDYALFGGNSTQFKLNCFLAFDRGRFAGKRVLYALQYASDLLYKVSDGLQCAAGRL